MNKRIFLSAPHIGGQELDFVHEAFAFNYIAPVGPQIDAFEREFADTVGAKYAAAVASGTAALHLLASELEQRAAQNCLPTLCCEGRRIVDR